MASMAEIECPNCQARYQVPLEALGPTGRDVTCSSCGNIWHATPIAQERPIEAGVLGTQTRAPDRREKMEELRRKLEQVQGEGKRPDYGGPGYVTAEDNYSRRWGESGEAAVERKGDVRQAVFGQNYDDDDEFERTDSALRDRMTSGGQSQRLRNVRGGKDPEAGGARGRMMNKHRKRTKDYVDRKRRNSGGGGTGFWFVVIVAGVLYGMYALDDQIVAQIPAAEPAMRDYVAAVDTLRGNIRSTVDGLTAGGEGEG